MDAIGGKGVGEALESHRERSSILHPDVSLTESIVRVKGPPNLPVQPCLNFCHHKSQYILSSSYWKFYLFGAAKKRKKQGGDRRKGTVSAEGKGGIEGTEPKRKALESEDFCSYYWGQKSLLQRSSALTLIPAPFAFRESSGRAGRNQVWPVCFDVCV